MGFHICHQLELGAAAVKVLALPVGAEIGIANQIVGKEAHATLKGHKLCAPGQILKLGIGEGIPCAFQESSRSYDEIMAFLKSEE